MKKKENDTYDLSQKMLAGASDYIKRKAFKKNSQIIIIEDDKLYRLDNNKNNNKNEIKTVKVKNK
jgi:hypothetical protein